MNTTFHSLSKILVKTFSLAPEQLTPDASLVGLNIDSLGTVELLWQVEEVFGISLPSKPPELLTLGDVVRFIDGLVADGHAVVLTPVHAPAHAAPMPARLMQAAEATAMPHP